VKKRGSSGFGPFTRPFASLGAPDEESAASTSSATRAPRGARGIAEPIATFQDSAASKQSWPDSPTLTYPGMCSQARDAVASALRRRFMPLSRQRLLDCCGASPAIARWRRTFSRKR